MLDTIAQARKDLQLKIKAFNAGPPSALRIKVDGKHITFPIDKESGRVSPPEHGAWGWVKDFRWLELKEYLRNVHRYEVEVMGEIAPVLS